MADIHIVFIQTLGIITLGYTLKRLDIIKLADGKSLSKLLMHTTFPALMLVSTLNVDLSAQLLLVPFLCMIYCGIMLTMALFWFKNYDNRLRGVLTMGAGGFNVGLFGFPIIEGLFGKEALLYAILYDIGNSLMVFIVVYGIGQYFMDSNSKVDFKKIGLKIISLPPFMAMILGLTLNFCSVELPKDVFSFLEILSRANKPLVLLLMGIYLRFSMKKEYFHAILKVLSLRYVTAFLVLVFLYFVLNNLDPEYKILSICALLPLGLTILPFSDEFGYDSEIAGSLVNFSLLISFIAMWCFMLFS